MEIIVFPRKLLEVVSIRKIITPSCSKKQPQVPIPPFIGVSVVFKRIVDHALKWSNTRSGGKKYEISIRGLLKNEVVTAWSADNYAVAFFQFLS